MATKKGTTVYAREALVHVWQVFQGSLSGHCCHQLMIAYHKTALTAHGVMFNNGMPPCVADNRQSNYSTVWIEKTQILLKSIMVHWNVFKVIVQWSLLLIYLQCQGWRSKSNRGTQNHRAGWETQEDPCTGTSLSNENTYTCIRKCNVRQEEFICDRWWNLGYYTRGWSVLKKYSIGV